MNTKIIQLRKQVRLLLIFFMMALVISGATALPISMELNIILKMFPAHLSITRFLSDINQSLIFTQQHYPFLLYGYDWLAFGHFVIALAFIGPFKNPVRNIWVLDFGMIACIMVLPFAFIMGEMRGVPIYWRLIDCSFGVIGIMPLWLCRIKIKKMETLMEKEKLNLIF